MTEKQYGPRIGEWYKDEKGVSFEVITVDDEEQLIQVQYFDGSVEDLDFDIWNKSGFISRAPPEEWSIAGDGLELDYLGNSGERLQQAVWSGPLD